MIIKTKTTKTRDGGISEQTISENKPGLKLRKKVINSYQTKVKPGVKKAVFEAGSDFKEMITGK